MWKRTQSTDIQPTGRGIRLERLDRERRPSSCAYDHRNGGQLRGYDSLLKSIPGYAGHVPAKVPENIFADTFTKTVEKCLDKQFTSRDNDRKRWSLLSKGGTRVPPVPANIVKEVPLISSCYQATSPARHMRQEVRLALRSTKK